MHRNLHQCIMKAHVPFPRLPPMVTAYVTTVQYENQGIDWYNCSLHYRFYSEFSNFYLHTSVYVWKSITLGSFIICIDSCNHHHSYVLSYL